MKVTLYDVRKSPPVREGSITLKGDRLIVEGADWIRGLTAQPAGILKLVAPAATERYLRALEEQFANSTGIRAELGK
jgi:hypothetical protein